MGAGSRRPPPAHSSTSLLTTCFAPAAPPNHTASKTSRDHTKALNSALVFRYLIRRLLWAIVLFLAVTMVTYMIFYIIPANPARLACGQRATESCIAQAEHRLGLDRPVPVQYALFLKRLVIDRSLGTSFTNRRNVTQTILDAAPVTASLVFGGAILWMLIALPVGILSALRPRSLMDRAATVFVLIGISPAGRADRARAAVLRSGIGSGGSRTPGIATSSIPRRPRPVVVPRSGPTTSCCRG